MRRAACPRRFALAALLVVLTAACQSTTPPPPEPTPAPTTPRTSTTAAPTTRLTTTTTSTTVADTTTTTLPPESTAPPTTISPTMAAVAAYLIGDRAVVNCYAQLPNCDTSSFADFFVDPARTDIINDVGRLIDDGILIRNLDSYRTFVRSAVSIDDQHVVVTFCAEDGMVIFRPTATGDVVLNDAFGSAINEVTMVLGTDGEWRLADYNQTEKVFGKENSLCVGG